MATRLTQKELKAIVAVLDERIAGGTDDLRDALGMTDEEADQAMGNIESGATKLAERIK